MGKALYLNTDNNAFPTTDEGGKNMKSMKKCLRMLLPVLLTVCLLTGCAQAEKTEGDDLTPYRAALMNETEIPIVYYGGDQGTARLEDAFPDLDASFPRFALADVDGDGLREIVLEINVGDNAYYGFLVLGTREDGVQAYEFSVRGLADLKADGTASWSDGAADNGFGRVTFEDDGYTFANIAHSAMEEDGVHYYAGETPIDEKEFNRLLDEQDEKPDAEWQPFTAENIAALFS